MIVTQYNNKLHRVQSYYSLVPGLERCYTHHGLAYYFFQLIATACKWVFMQNIYGFNVHVDKLKTKSWI